MRFTRLFPLAMAAVLCLSGCQPDAEEPSEPEAPAEETVSDEELLDAITDEFTVAWANADAAAIAGLFTMEGDSVGPEGDRHQGRAEIQGRYENLLGGMYQGTTLSITQTSVKFPSPDVAIVDGTYEIRGISTGDGATSVSGVYTNVAVKEGGEWKIHCSRPMIPLTPPPAEGT